MTSDVPGVSLPSVVTAALDPVDGIDSDSEHAARVSRPAVHTEVRTSARGERAAGTSEQ
jgi:hypothetical protein